MPSAQANEPRSGADQLANLSIATLRTLSMDAVQAAGSGHPGTAMAMAPAVYELWQEFLRFDPDDPIWPNRDRFVLSIGHASTLLYSVLHLTGVKAVDAHYERLGEPSVTLDDLKKFRQLDSKCPGHPEYRWTSGVETTTGPLGQGVATSVGMALAATVAGGALQPARLSALRLRRLRHVRRRLHDGGRRVRGGVAGRAPSARQPLLDLRQQPHHDRGPHRARFQRRRGHAVRRLRLERHAGRRRQRPRDAASRLHDLQAHHRPADPDHRRQPHRLRRASQAGHERRPRRAAGRRRGRARQAQLRLAGRRAVPRAGRRRSTHFRRRPGRARAGRLARTAWEATYAGLCRAASRDWPRNCATCSTGSCRRLGPRSRAVSRQPDRHVWTRRVECRPERDGQPRAVAHRRLGRPGPVDQDPPDVRRRRRLRRRGSAAAATCISACASTPWARC